MHTGRGNTNQKCARTQTYKMLPTPTPTQTNMGNMINNFSIITPPSEILVTLIESFRVE